MPLPDSVSRGAIEPTIVTSRPSRIQTVPRPMTMRQWKRDQGSRSSRAGISVAMTRDAADIAPRSRPRDVFVDTRAVRPTTSSVATGFRTIILGLDGSAGCRPAVPVAADLARRYGAKIVIVHVDERVAAKGGVVPVRVDEDEIQAELKKLAAELSDEGIEVSVETLKVILGGPAHAIEHLAEEIEADLIVVGRRGHSPVVGLLLGSVALRLLGISKRPVLAVPPPAQS
jgi:nucleotide-binding universal stress UspA family protein